MACRACKSVLGCSLTSFEMIVCEIVACILIFLKSDNSFFHQNEPMKILVYRKVSLAMAEKLKTCGQFVETDCIRPIRAIRAYEYYSNFVFTIL